MSARDKHVVTQSLCAGLIVALLACSTSWSADLAAVDRLADRALREWRQPGLAIAVVDNGAVTLARGYGVRELDGRAPVTAQTLFAIGSCSKAFGAAAVAALVDERRLDWDDRVDRHLPWFRTDDAWVTHEIRVRDLLAHRTGLHASIPRIAASDKRAYLQSIAVAKPWHPLRAQFSYSNDAFTLAGALVSEVSGQAWDDYARERFWRPLGMARTNADHRVARGDADSATPHVMRAAEPVAVPWVYEDRIALPSGGINSTARDMAQWLRFQLTGRDAAGRAVLSRAALDQMHGPHTPLRGELVDPSRRAWGDVVGRGPGGIHGESYGLGWFVHDYRGYQVLAHPGAINGFRCYAALLPEQQFGAVVLLNSDRTMLSLALLQALIDLEIGVEPRDWLSLFRVRQGELDAERKAANEAIDATRIVDAPPSRVLTEYIGSFVREGLSSVIAITLDATTLRLTLDRAQYELEPWHYDVFALIPRKLRTEDGIIDWPAGANDARTFVTFRMDERGKLARIETPFGTFEKQHAGNSAHEDATSR